MKKLTLLLLIAAGFAACSGSSNSQSETLDTTPVLSPTNNQLRTGTDTLGFKTDSLSADSDSIQQSE